MIVAFVQKNCLNMSEIINALCHNHMKIKKMAEYDYDIGISEVYDHKGIPLSYILIAEKEQILV